MNKHSIVLIFFVHFFTAAFGQTKQKYIITTIAGDGTRKDRTGDGGPAVIAKLGYPSDLIIDTKGDLIFVGWGECVRKIDTKGIITTIAGNGTQIYSGDNLLATSVGFKRISSLAIDNSGNLYITDSYYVRRVNTKGIITTIAGNELLGKDGSIEFKGDGGPAISAEMDPEGLAIDNSGNIYIADCSNNRIRKVDVRGIITTVAGNGKSGYGGDGGPAIDAELNSPRTIVIDSLGNLYISDSFNNCIRKVDTKGIITTVAGNGYNGGAQGGGYDGDGGRATSAEFYFPWHFALDHWGNIFIADENNYRIRMVDKYGIVTTIAGNGNRGFSGDGEPATSCTLNSTDGIAVDDSGNIYIADHGNGRIRKLTPIKEK